MSKVKISKHDDWGKTVYYEKYETVEDLLNDESMVFDGIFDSVGQEEEFDNFINECKNLSFEKIVEKLNENTDFWSYELD